MKTSVLQEAGNIKNAVILIFWPIQSLNFIYPEGAWVLVFSGTQVQLQKLIDPDYLPDYLLCLMTLKILCNHLKWKNVKICLNACEQVEALEEKRWYLPSSASLLNVSVGERKHTKKSNLHETYFLQIITYLWLQISKMSATLPDGTIQTDLRRTKFNNLVTLFTSVYGVLCKVWYKRPHITISKNSNYITVINHCWRTNLLEIWEL